MKTSILGACALALCAVPSIAADKPGKPVELSDSELAALRSKTYAAPVSVTFPATVATLQSLGYLNITASKDAGTISGETEAKGKVIYNILWGFGKKKRTQLASLLVEDTGANESSVRLNLTVNEAKTRGFVGNAFRDGQIVKIAEPYQQFYAALDAEVARRLAR